MKLYLAGKYVEARQAGLPAFELRYFQGAALAEAMRLRSGKVEHLHEHAQRLAEGCKAMLFPPLDRALFASACRSLVRLNRLRQGSLRCRYFADGTLLIHPLPPRPLPKAPLRLITTSVRHYGAASLQGRLKASSMLPNWLARAEAQAWADDGLRLTPQGYVAEGVWSNIALARKGVLLTPPLHLGILEGVTRSRLLQAWKARRRPVRLQPLTRHDLYTADEIWICSSLNGPLRVAEVDGRKVGRVL